MSAKKLPVNGKRGSSPSRKRSSNDSKTFGSELEQLLGAIYDRFQTGDDPSVHAQCQRDFVFHMTDWTADLERLAELYQNPAIFSPEAADDIVSGFLYHVLPHLKAAGSLMLDYNPPGFEELDPRHYTAHGRK